jgi:RNA polymerase sigma-70 factor (ECF subfamily)
VAFHVVRAFRKRKNRDRLDFWDEFGKAVAEGVETHSTRLERRERALQQCLQKLPKAHRDVVVLRYHESLELEQMDVRLGRSHGALYRMLSRIRHRLHECVSGFFKASDYDNAS